MKVECVTVCDGYGDFLAATAPLNRPHFDRWVIITSPEDRETLDVCHRFNLTPVVTEELKRGGEFNKGRGIQRGFNALSMAGWVLHLDADVALPPVFPQALEMAHPDESVIYGCDRMMVKSYAEWQRIQGAGYHQHGRHCYILPHEKYPIGTRWGSPNDGYTPIGFFQFFHGSASVRKGFHVRPYPAHHSDAARSDVQFALQWDRRKRALLPELLVWHLESEPAAVGANWKGRTTARFGPAPSGAARGGPS